MHIKCRVWTSQNVIPKTNTNKKKLNWFQKVFEIHQWFHDKANERCRRWTWTTNTGLPLQWLRQKLQSGFTMKTAACMKDAWMNWERSTALDFSRRQFTSVEWLATTTHTWQNGRNLKANGAMVSFMDKVSCEKCRTKVSSELRMTACGTTGCLWKPLTERLQSNSSWQALPQAKNSTSSQCATTRQGIGAATKSLKSPTIQQR